MVAVVIGVVVAIGIVLAAMMIVSTRAARREQISRQSRTVDLPSSEQPQELQTAHRKPEALVKPPDTFVTWSGYRVKNVPPKRRRMGDKDHLQLGETHEP